MGYTIISRPVILHLIVTTVLWIWIRNATQAIARADRAEVIGQLKHAIAQQNQTIVEQKHTARIRAFR